MAGLGRGLNSLIPPKNNQIRPTTINPVIKPVREMAVETERSGSYNKEFEPQTETVFDTKDRVLSIPVEKITANTHQPRTHFANQALADLAESIKEHGVLQPLVVVKKGADYELIAGERRLRASKIAGLEKVPAIVREASVQQKMELALIENIQREDLNPIEVAMSLQRLAEEFNLSQEDLARRLGKSRSSVANSLRLLNLPETMQTALENGLITEGHAKILLGLDSTVKQEVLFKKILANKMSVSSVSDEVRKSGGTKQAKVKKDSLDEEKEAIIREFFGTKAVIKRGRVGGQIIISFYDNDDLKEILSKLKTEG